MAWRLCSKAAEVANHIEQSSVGIGLKVREYAFALVYAKTPTITESGFRPLSHKKWGGRTSTHELQYR